MIKDDIFFEDVEVPEIVQKKADSAFLTIQTERSHRMKDTIKKEQNTGKNQRGRRVIAGRLAAAAACMAVIVAAGALTGPLRGMLGHFGHADPSGTGTEDILLTALEDIDKIFTLQVKAAGSEEEQAVLLEEGKPLPVVIGDDKAGSWVFNGDEESGIVSYCISLPQLTCEGDEIESITYSVNNGAFQIVQPENEQSIIADGQLYDGELNTGSIGGDYDEERGGEPSRPFETLLYKSFTLNYDKQSDEYTWLNICNECSDSEDIIQALWGEHKTMEECNSGIQKMLDHTVITCTVNYADKTSQSADIKVDSRVMTRKEAGEPEEEGINPEEKITVITFELQQAAD